MRRLTNMQIDHLTARIHDATNELARREIKKLGTAPELIEYTDEQKMQLISCGKAIIKDKTNASRYHVCVTDFFDYVDTAPMRKAREKRKLYDQKVQAIHTETGRTRQRLRDEAILGDSIEAMQMLQALERKVQKA
jgi:hypothetical protein